MVDDWGRETRRVVESFDRIADLYRREFADELHRKPFDRDLLDALVHHFPTGAPVLEVGAGPAHISAYLATRGVRMLASDASVGQLREAQVLDPGRAVVAADLARLPVRPGGLAGIVAFYCLIYGPAEHLDRVFADWQRALRPGGLVTIAVHAGEGRVQHADEWFGRPIDLTVVRRDPDDLVTRLRDHGFVIEQRTTRPRYADEQTDRLYVVARRTTTT